MYSLTKYPRFAFNNGRARDSFLRQYFVFFSLYTFERSPRTNVHSKLRLYILFSIEIHHSLIHRQHAFGIHTSAAIHTHKMHEYMHETAEHSTAYACCHKEMMALHHSHTHANPHAFTRYALCVACRVNRVNTEH